MTPEQLAAARHAAIEDIRTHFAAWTGLLQAYVDSLPPDTEAMLTEGGEARSYAQHELRAMWRDLGALLDIPVNQPTTQGWRSMACQGETCSICDNPASGKVEEAVFADDPVAVRHPLTAYLCRNHFRLVMGDAGCDRVENYRQQMVRARKTTD